MDLTKNPRNHLSNRAKKVHGEMYVTNGATTAITLYDVGGASVTLGSTDRLYITRIHVSTDTAGEVAVFVGADSTPAAGEYAVRTFLAANSNTVVLFNDCFIGQAGANAYGSTSGGGSAKVAITLNGYVQPTA